MSGSWITREYLWMFNEVELFQIGVLVDWVVGLGLRELEVKILIRSSLAENHNRLHQYMLTQRSQGHGKIAMHRGRSPGERGRDRDREHEKSRERSHDKMRDSDPREDRHHKDHGRSRDRERERGQGRDHGWNRAGIVIWTVVMITTGNVDGIAIVKGIGTMIVMTDYERGRSRDRDYDVESKHEQDRPGDREREYADIEPKYDREWYGHPEPENKLESYDHYERHCLGQLNPDDEQEHYEGIEPDDYQDRFDCDDSRPR